MKLFDWLRPKLRVPDPALEPAPRSSEEQILAERLSHARDGAPLGADEWAAIERLLTRGHEAEAIDILRRWIASQPRDLDATMRLSELLCGRREHALARPLLERLTTSTPHRLRAFSLLGEGAERAGDLDAARIAYERALAIDLGHVAARAAADRLRPRKDGSIPGPPPDLGGPAEIDAPVGDRYRLRAELGRGTSGTVYLADDIEVDRQIALKILHPRARGAQLHAWEEARVSASIGHPGVVVIYDLDEERQLIAMELCRGGSLRERLARGPLAPRETLGALAQLCAALAAAHERGVVHGDVKPANLLLRRVLLDDAPPLDEDELVLCDFGIARLRDDSVPHVQRGTLAYMAPEQRRGVLDAPVDLYAVGVVAVELFLGLDAPSFDDRAALLRAEPRYDGSLPRKVLAQLGTGATAVSALLASLLSPDPAARPTALVAAELCRSLLL